MNCDLNWIETTPLTVALFRIGNADIVIFTMQAAAMGWAAQKTPLAVMFVVQAFPVCYDVGTGGRAGIEFQVTRSPQMPSPSKTEDWPVLTATPTATDYGHPYLTSVYTGL